MFPCFINEFFLKASLFQVNRESNGRFASKPSRSSLPLRTQTLTHPMPKGAVKHACHAYWPKQSSAVGYAPILQKNCTKILQDERFCKLVKEEDHHVHQVESACSRTKSGLIRCYKHLGKKSHAGKQGESPCYATLLGRMTKCFDLPEEITFQDCFD